MVYVSILVGLAPVLMFLAALIVLDSYRLVSFKSILRSVCVGILAAAVALLVNRWLLGMGAVGEAALKRAMGPLVEESLKALFIAYLIRSEKVGFMVDAGIHGFAVGAGFALLENVYYYQALQDPQIGLWIVRGFGTAVLHGSCTAIFGIVSKGLMDRHSSAAPYLLLPGFALAFALHALFNQFILNPVVETAVILIGMPLLVAIVFEQSERATRHWLGTGFDTDVELLELILNGEIGDSKVGQYLESLKAHFQGHVVGDMLCYLRIHLELSLRAKGMLIARGAGLTVPIDEQVRANFEELKYLERSIGKTGKIAILPIMRTGSRDLWQIYMLGK
jgi:RsiW-degrading membrane proteinase PrsW (M82 family)